MSTLFSGINLALRAVLTHQQAIQVTNHNVANANTKGYSRQEAVLAAGTAYSVGMGTAGQIGTGVYVQRIRRFNLDFFDGRYRQESGEAKRWEVKRDILKQVEVSLAETSTDSLTSKLDNFWAGWKAVADDPQSIPLREDLIDRAKQVADAFNWRSEQLRMIRKDQDLSLQQNVQEVNSIAEQIARINIEIRRVTSVGDQPNDLSDKRDVLLDRLAELTGATSQQQENGEVMVSIGGHILVMGNSTLKLTAEPNPANDNLVEVRWADNGQLLNAPRGEIKGLLEARDEDIVTQIKGLNDLAQAFATRINELQQSGYSLDTTWTASPPPPTPPYDRSPALFDLSGTGGAAAQIHINSEIFGYPSRIAAAQTINAAGDGSNANAITNVQYELLMGGGTTTFNNFYTQQVGKFGLAIEQAKDYATDHQLVAESLNSMSESVSGVNLDEEAANLAKEQRAFEAASRLLTAFDEMLDRIINSTGLVGR
jgi:flagellar hook-associated protein 1 FlgK